MAQFYLDGYRSGDPFLSELDPSVAARSTDLPERADVLIVGCGPAGLVLAAQMAHFPDVRTVVIDRREGPLEVGQADGVACRTVEMFEAFGLADRVIDEGYQVNEVSFWRAGGDGAPGIVRTGRIADVEDGLSEMPHVIVNQARMLTFLREDMQRSAARIAPFYGLRVDDLRIETGGTSDHPVTVTVSRFADGAATDEVSEIRAKYVVGCDGARSAVRTSIGRRLDGDATNQSWGVMDVLAVTDFPDIRLKSAITSASGSMLIIPREGGYLVRLYIELDNVVDREMLRAGTITPEELAVVANRILSPYTLEVRDVGWWSVYEVGQRLCDKFDDVPTEDVPGRAPRVFIAGDACHTHSAKAGQGMNVSMADTWNLGWKLAAVLRGRARPELLHTYSSERQAVARELIDFDREFAAMFTATPEVGSGDGDVDPEKFQRYFREQGRFTAGVAVRYGPSMITDGGASRRLADGFPVGMRFHSAPVVRLADAKPMHLGHVARADGAWRLYLFADQRDPMAESSSLRRLCSFLASEGSPIHRFTPAGADPDSVIDVRAVFQQDHRDLSITGMPAVLLPRKGRFGLTDYEKMFCPDAGAEDIFDLRRIDRDAGCVIVVRPDQYVAHQIPLHDHTALTDFFARILIDADGAG